MVLLPLPWEFRRYILKENFQPHRIRNICTLYAGALVSDSLLHMLPYQIQKQKNKSLSYRQNAFYEGDSTSVQSGLFLTDRDLQCVWSPNLDIRNLGIIGLLVKNLSRL